MSAQPAVKHMYLSVISAAGLGGLISVGGSAFLNRNTVTTEELDRKLKPITDTLARNEKLLEKTATKAEVDKRLNEIDKKLNGIQWTLNKKTRCFLA